MCWIPLRMGLKFDNAIHALTVHETKREETLGLSQIVSACKVPLDV
jgi:hypothetical protein